MKTQTQTAAALYVGTYEKYNNGSLKGEWVKLENFTSADDFIDYCKELHSDEEDPEFMFQDFEGFPRSLYSESASPEELEKLFDFVNLDDYDKKIVEMYADATGYGFDDFTTSDALDAFQGTERSEADFAQRTAEECGEINKDLSSWIIIDWDASWSCNLRHDYNTAEDENGEIYFFLNH